MFQTYLAACICLFMLTESISAPTSQTVTFETKAWTIHLDPATLGIHATLIEGRHIRISDPVTQPAAIQNLQQKPTSESWKISHIPLTITCRLEDTALSVHFQTDSTGTFTCPILDNTSDIQAYILPLFEGSYVPAKDDRWIQFLTRRSPLHNELGLRPLTAFTWLTPDRQVQKTVFGSNVELIANFGTTPFPSKNIQIPGRSILSRWS